jgi:CYTH domain-containing protein
MHQAKKKYLLNDSIKKLIDDLQIKPKTISEYYTVAKVCKEVKYSKINSKYFKTMKTGVVSSYDQKREKITKKHYEKEKKRAIGQQITKKRYEVKSENRIYTIDIYKKSLKNLNMLEIKFNKLRDFNNFLLPELFNYHVSREITKSERYQNKNLALLGDPKKNDYNIYSIFKDIELGRITDLNSVIFKEMKTSDAIRTILYKLFVDLRLTKDLIVETDAKKGLKRYDSILKKSLLLLDQYKNIFDKHIYHKVRSNLKTMRRVIKTYKDLQFIEDKLDTLKPILDQSKLKSFKDTIRKKRDRQIESIIRYFTTREFSIIFKQYELMLKENNRSFLTIDAQTSIENSLNHKISIRYKKSLMLSDKYEGCKDLTSQKAIKRSIKTLILLLENYDIITDKEKNITMYNSAKTLLKELNRLQKLNKERLIINTYMENLKPKPHNFEELVKQIEKQTKIATDKNNKALLRSIEKFTKL